MNKFCLGYYPHFVPNNFERECKRKLMKRFLFCRYSFIILICVCAKCFGQLIFFLGQLDREDLLPKGQCQPLQKKKKKKKGVHGVVFLFIAEI